MLGRLAEPPIDLALGDRKSTRLNSSHLGISYAVFCLKKKKNRVTTRNSAQLTQEQQTQPHNQPDQTALQNPQLTHEQSLGRSVLRQPKVRNASANCLC